MTDPPTTGEDEPTYSVVVNAEEQYAIWPATSPIPAGWRDEGTRGPRGAVLEHVARTWTDMRPLSVRRALEAERNEAPPASPPRERGPSLVERLAAGDQPVVVLDALPEALARGVVLVRFGDSAGGTELRLQLDRSRSDVEAVELASGTARLVGELRLDSRAVRCIVRVDVVTRTGIGWLEP